MNSLKAARDQGGPNFDFLNLNLDSGELSDPFQPEFKLANALASGRYEVLPPKTESKGDATVLRSIGIHLEYPFLRLSQHQEEETIRSLHSLRDSITRGEPFPDEARAEVDRMIRNARLGAAGNRFYESDEPVEKAMREVIEELARREPPKFGAVTKRPRWPGLPQFVKEKTPHLSAPKSLPARLLTPYDEFQATQVKEYHSKFLYHGTKRTDFPLTMARNGKNSTLYDRPGFYVTPSLGTTTSYANLSPGSEFGMILKYSLKKEAAPKILDWPKVRNLPEIVKIIDETHDASRHPFEYLGTEYGVDLIIGGNFADVPSEMIVENPSILKLHPIGPEGVKAFEDYCRKSNTRDPFAEYEQGYQRFRSLGAVMPTPDEFYTRWVATIPDFNSKTLAEHLRGVLYGPEATLALHALAKADEESASQVLSNFFDDKTGLIIDSRRGPLRVPTVLRALSKNKIPSVLEKLIQKGFKYPTESGDLILETILPAYEGRRALEFWKKALERKPILGQALGASPMSDSTKTELIADCFKADSRQIKLGAAVALSSYRGPKFAELALPILTSNDQEFKEALLVPPSQGRGNSWILPTEAGFEYIMAGLEQGQPKAREMIIALGREQNNSLTLSSEQRDQIIDKIMTGPKENREQLLGSFIKHLRGARLTGVLKALIQDTGYGARDFCSQLSDSDSLVALSHSETFAHRACALLARITLRTADTYRYLVEAMADPSEEVRSLAIKISFTSNITPDQHLALMEAGLRDTSPSVKNSFQEYLTFLGQSTGKAHFPTPNRFIQQSILSPDQNLRKVGYEVGFQVATISGKDLEYLITQGLGDENADIVKLAVEKLKATPEIKPADLIQALSSNPRVESKRAQTQLIKYLKEYDPEGCKRVLEQFQNLERELHHSPSTLGCSP